MTLEELIDVYKEPFFFECHLGMRELVLPLLSGENLIGILFVGQCRIAGEEKVQYGCTF